MSDFLKDLNDIQLQAVEHINGPTMIIAGAGSGKTRVLTYRIANLLAHKKTAYSIMALTFTNKAAKEMKKRIAELVGESVARNLWMGTFHSLFAKILRTEAVHIGFPADFTIYDTIDSKAVLKSIINELNLDESQYKINEIYHRISTAKNNLVTAHRYKSEPTNIQNDIAARKPEFARIFEQYTLRCKKSGAMDFDDLLLQTNILFKEHPDILAKYQNKFKYVLVDEYQDTNISQYLIIKKLSEVHQNICVVGDDAQSIYGFRGAKIENILNFQKDYKNCAIFKLERNYRSTQNIVDAASSIIAKNKHQLPKAVYSENEIGSKIRIVQALTDHEEGYQIAQAIHNKHLTEQLLFNNFAILYRTNSQSRILEEALRKYNIPYRIYGGISFYQRKEIKDLFAYLRLTINPNDDEAFKRVINYPKRGIGETSVDKIELAANANNLSMWQICSPTHRAKIGITARTLTPIDNFINLIKSFADFLQTFDAYDLARTIATNSGILKDLYQDKTPEGVARHDNIQELLNGVREYVKNNTTEELQLVPLGMYLQDAALLTGDENDDKDDRNKVSLMTVHSAKGLEFKCVFIAGMEEGLFPSQMSVNTLKEIEEERRLFYVAITRAETNLTISFAKSRYRWGSQTDCKPSRFIDEIDIRYLDMPDFDFQDYEFNLQQKQISGKKIGTFNFNKIQNNVPTPAKQKIQLNIPQPKTENSTTTKNTNPTPPIEGKSILKTGLKEGNKVFHEKFGIGTVEIVEGIQPNITATINFENVGRKKLLLKFAKLLVIQ